MKDTIKKVLKEQNRKELSFDDGSVLPRMIRPQKVSSFSITRYKSRGYNPFYFDGYEIKELPSVSRDRINQWGEIYFFNDDEVSKIYSVQEKITEIKEQIKKQMELYDKFVYSFVHDKII